MPERRFRVSLLAACLLVLISWAAVLAGQAAESQPETQRPIVHLTWRAPFGDPRAVDSIGVSCADSSRIDTLYLSFEPSQDESAFVAAGGEIIVHPVPGDSIGPFWQMGKGGANRGGMTLQIGPDPDIPGTSAWNRSGVGVVDYDWTSTRGRFRFMYAMAPDAKMHLRKGERYTLGRFLIRGMASRLPGCDAAVSLEWDRTEFDFVPGEPSSGRSVTGRGNAFVLRGAAGAARTAAVRGSAPRPWTPPGTRRP